MKLPITKIQNVNIKMSSSFPSKPGYHHNRSVMSLGSTFLFLFFFPFLPLLAFYFFRKNTLPKNPSESLSKYLTPAIPKVYPFVGSLLALYQNWNRQNLWLSDVIQISPTPTFVLHLWFGKRQIITADPAVVEHVLKTRFHVYQRGDTFRSALKDFLGSGIFTADGDDWKFQRQVASHEFNTKSLRNFVETVVDTELSGRLIPILKEGAAKNSVLNFQDVLQRFGFDTICQIAFGYDPACLSPSFPEPEFAQAFEDGVTISVERFISTIPIVWKFKKFFDIGSEKRLRKAVAIVRGYATKIIEEKKKELKEKDYLDSVDLLSRFLSCGHSDENFVTDIVISFILAGRDTTSGALTWFFWLLSRYPEVEKKIFEEVNNKSEAFSAYDEVKDMTYIHAAICESMRLYPPVPVDTKHAAADDVLPDGTMVKKGMRVAYHSYAMGRLESIWGKDWAEFKPERWLQREDSAEGTPGKWRFVGRDNFTYPVFHAGPRICLGRDMAFLQMKRLLAEIVKQFRVVPVAKAEEEPVFNQRLTAEMKGGFWVRIEQREKKE